MKQFRQKQWDDVGCRVGLVVVWAAAAAASGRGGIGIGAKYYAFLLVPARVPPTDD